MSHSLKVNTTTPFNLVIPSSFTKGKMGYSMIVLNNLALGSLLYLFQR